MIVSEILDKLSINCIYLIKKKKISAIKLKEIDFIKKKTLEFFKKGKIDQKYIYYLCLLTFINYKIWDYKEKMFLNKKNVDKKNLKLSHQLNSIRNQIKNKILIISNKKNKLIKTNIDKENLRGWELILNNKKNLFSSTKIKFKNSNLGETLDTLTILQLKEIKLQNKSAKINFYRFINNNQILIKNNQKEILLLLPFLAIINNFIWDLKDKIILEKNFYYHGLNKSQNLNSLRNIIKNKINKLNNYKKDLRTGIFYDQKFKNVIKKIEIVFKIDLLNQVSERSKVAQAEFEKIFLLPNEKLIKYAADIFYKKKLEFNNISENEKEKIKLFILKKIFGNELWVSGNKKKFIWERGWKQNLLMFKKNKNINSLTPKFLGSKKYLRYKKTWIKPNNKNFEFDLVEVYRSHIFKKYFSDVKNIYEFGCGSAQHVMRLGQLFPEKKIFGLDWAKSSIDIVTNLRKTKSTNFKGLLFDMFHPNYKIKIQNNSAFLTVGAMEQLGTNFDPFLKFMLKKKPKVVIHIETIEEFYDENNLFDLLAKIYDKKRNYLSGYFKALKGLEEQKKIKIMRVKKVNFGSMMHDSYSTIIWRVI
jgi:hypothetical protein